MRRRRRAEHGPDESVGSRGESAAIDALRATGHRIEGRNVRTRHGEIDVLARIGRTWIAVEVKTRRGDPAPERCVAEAQLERVARALWALAPTLRPRPRCLRVDLVAVRLPRGAAAEVRHWPGTPSHPPGAAGAGGAVRASGRRIPVDHPRGPSAPRVAMPNLSEQIIPRRKLLLMVSETAIFATVLLVGTSVGPLTSASYVLDPGTPGFWRGLLSCVFVAILCQIAMAYNDLYDWKVAQNRAELPNRLLHAAGYALVMMALAVFAVPSLFHFPGLAHVARETWKLILLLGVAFVAIWAWRMAFHWFFYKWNFGERVVVFGAGSKARSIAQMIVDHPFAGFEVVGLVRAEADPPPDRQDADRVPRHHRVLGSWQELSSLAREHRASRVVVALEERRGTFPVEALLKCRMDGMVVEEKEVMYERLHGKLAVESLRPSYLIFGTGFAKHRITAAIKRAIDIVVSLALIAVTLPLCLLVCLAIKLDSKGPVLFRQRRVGQDGAVFWVLKFRTMRVDAEANGPMWAAEQDVRVTRVGRVLRRTRFDEIPQALNVLTGKMSFVGPRPEVPQFVEQLSQQIPYYPLRHTVKPGLTGWAQVNFPYGASVEDSAEKLRFDLYYVKHMSLLFDLNIILRTVGVILFGKGAR